MRKLIKFLGLGALFSVVAATVAVAVALPRPVEDPDTAHRLLAMATVGDSDTHGYQDEIALPDGDGPRPRGGVHRATTYQWTEVLDRLRGNEINLGPRTVSGMPGRLSHLLEGTSLPTRSPRKHDHLYNFAVSGNGCDDLWEGYRQVPNLLKLMDRDPAKWRHGVVVFRIGVKDIAMMPFIEQLASGSDVPGVHARVDRCVAEIGKSVAAVRARHPDTYIVLVGLFNNAHWANYLDRWQSPEPLQRIATAVNRYDDGLKRIAVADKRIAFFDDQAWFAKLWGSRAADGRPAFHTLSISDSLQVTNTTGDAPVHATLEDGHAGVVWNAKWAQSMVVLLNASFGLNLTPISDDEVRRFLTESPGRPSR